MGSVTAASGMRMGLGSGKGISPLRKKGEGRKEVSGHCGVPYACEIHGSAERKQRQVSKPGGAQKCAT